MKLLLKIIFNNLYVLFFATTLFTTIVLTSCGSKDNKNSKAEENAKPEAEKEEEYVPYSLDYPEINYNLVELKSRKEVNEVINKYNNTELAEAYKKALRTLNRKELRFFKVGESVIVPDSVIDDIRAYSIFPDDYFGARNLEKIIIIDNQFQAYACYEFGKLVRFAAANTGKERTPTFPGRYSLVWKQKLRHSSLDSTWIMPHTFNFHKYAGNAMHEFSMPGRPVSHSCVRQFADDAEWIYKWGKSADYDSAKRTIPHSGTPVIIVNMFDYSRKKGGPWLELSSNKSHYVALPENPMDVEEALIPWAQIPMSSRGAIPHRERFLYAEDTLRARGIIKPDVKLIETVDFNKLRREKKKREEEKLAREKEEAEKANIEGIENSETESPETNEIEE
jgi:lipoprotein-anchoring transpeptidase ErfK/SrfK